MVSWQTELDALVEQTRAFIESLGAKAIAVKPTLEPVLALVEQVLKVDQRPTSVLVSAQLSDREEIKQRVANFKAHQQKMQNERDEYFVRTMMQAGAKIAAAPTRLENSDAG
jgi:hypothetical protein